MWSMSGRVVAGLLVAGAIALTPAPAFAQGPREQYTTRAGARAGAA